MFKEVVIGIAKQLDLRIEEENNIYRLYENEQKLNHKKHFFEGDSEETYRKLVLVERCKSEKENRKH